MLDSFLDTLSVEDLERIASWHKSEVRTLNYLIRKKRRRLKELDPQKELGLGYGTTDLTTDSGVSA